MEIKSEFTEVTFKVTAEEYRLITLALANLADPGSVKGRPDKGENLPLAAAQLNFKMLSSRKTMLEQQLQRSEAICSVAGKMLHNVAGKEQS